MPTPKPVMLVILDGFGWREDDADNAVRQARTPNFDRLWQAGPRAFLRTCGRDVGLPDGQMGNSEVGHLNIGAGRVVMQELPRIDAAIEDGSIAHTEAFACLVAALKASGGRCHLMGLVSDGGVHAHQAHALGLAKLLDAEGIATVLHVFTDGRDTAPQSGREFTAALVAGLPPSVSVGTLTGRYFAMDRDNRWERVQTAYDAIRSGTSDHHAASADAAIAAAYATDTTDEFIPATVIGDYAGMADGDGILSFNFRADRIRELLGAFLLPDFDGFAIRPVNLAAVATMTRYSDKLAPHISVIFPPQRLDNLLGDTVSAAGKRQLRMAETEKYPHVTYFLNGGREVTLEGEDRIMVPSPKVATYDLQPEMSAPELTDKAVAAIASGQYDLIVLNYANPDMVGHTGSLSAAIKAVEAVDTGLGRLAEAVAAQGGALLFTADHGNCETMRDAQTGGPHTAHTLNVVPVALTGVAGASLHDGRLADLAPTLLALMGIAQPSDMTGRSLLD